MKNFGMAALSAAAMLIAMTPASHAQSVARTQLALEQVLDRLERGEAGRPPSLIGMLSAVVGGRTR